MKTKKVLDAGLCGANYPGCMLCAANLRYLFPFLKTSWYFICAVGRPHFHYTRRSFHYIIFFTFPNRAGGCRSAKATQSIRRKIFRFYVWYSADDGSSRALATAYRILAARRGAKRRAGAVRIPPCKACYKNRKQHPARCCFWRRWWESNPRDIAVKLISSQSRYDHFDTAPYLSQHQPLGKRGELMGRTSKNIKLRIPEKPHKIKGFRSGSYRVATTISSQV